jgi:filamentous hemagglutinin
VQWDQVALAHDQWNYSQSGLTPAGAALLSIAIAAYTGGLGVEALGGTGSTLGGAALTTTTAAGAIATTALGTAVTLAKHWCNWAASRASRGC